MKSPSGDESAGLASPFPPALLRAPAGSCGDRHTRIAAQALLDLEMAHARLLNESVLDYSSRTATQRLRALQRRGVQVGS